MKIKTVIKTLNQKRKNQKIKMIRKNKEQGGGLSKQQMDNLLEAVNNIEKDLNEKT